MNFTGAIKTCLRKYVCFKGRASRSEYWYFKLFTNSLLLLSYISASLNSANNSSNILFDFILILTFLPNLTVEVRRLHDINKSGWWILLNITLIGYILIVGYWAVKRSDKGENKYGPNPYHEVNDSENEYKSIKSIPNWLLALSISFSLVIVVDIVYVNLIAVGYIPSSIVKQSNNISSLEKNKLIDNGVIWQDEKIEHLYTKGNFSILEKGLILTSDSLISYFQDENDEILVNKIAYQNIKNVVLSFINDEAVYIVTSKSETIKDDITLKLSENGFWDQYFIRKLKAKLS